MTKNILVAGFLAASTLLSAQTSKRPDNWFNLDPATDKVNGVSTERSYKELLKDKKSTTIIVGVIDSGVDTAHEDLRKIMWTNPREIAGNGLDDDNNGYVDDIHGWNFIGGKDGRNVKDDNLEMTRLVRKLKPKYDGKTEGDFKSSAEKEEFRLYQKANTEYTKSREQNEQLYNQLKFMYEGFSAMSAKIKSQQKVEKVTVAELEKFTPEDKSDTKLKTLATTILKNNKDRDLDGLAGELKGGMEYYKSQLDYGLNIDFDPRSIVGDDYNNSSERNYGNSDCTGPDAFHGTHVAGIIAASRGNGIGMDGIAADVRIMSIRAVPAGDERDKDVANAIRYAVDNGAQIINMSFGKKYSWDKKAVDDAVKYAESKGVLLIHAAGNDGANIDEEVHYPCKKFEGRGEAQNFLDIGALSWKEGENAVAPFSNYGKKTVDLFSPGVEIYSTVPGSKYKDASGTSMAAPVTAGVAAVLKSYYPSLTAKQIKKILVKSSRKDLKSKKVIKPGTKEGDKDHLVKFDKLSKTAGMVNLYEALKMAEKYAKTKT
jgi:cell wall-associated protease